MLVVCGMSLACYPYVTRSFNFQVYFCVTIKKIVRYNLGARKSIRSDKEKWAPFIINYSQI